MVRIRAKRRALNIERTFTGIFEGTAVLVGAVVVSVILSLLLLSVGLKSFKISQENEWLRGRIETLKMEKESLQRKVSEMISELEVDGR